ncbi:MAG: DUF3667 domain-containing protein [Ignavibacteria bacterium]
MECKNCGNEFEGKFCNQCGQKIVKGRFTIKDIIENFMHSFTHLDSGILLLMKELFVKPGFVIKEYLNGKQKKYFNPFQFLILAIALATFLAIKFTLFGPNLNPDSIEGINSQQRFWMLYNNFIYRNFNLILFTNVPVTALFTLLFFRKSGYNYAENLIFVTFLAGERMLIYILLTPLIYFTRSNWYIGIGIYYLLWSVYYGYAFVDFFGGNKILTVLKYFCVLVLLILSSQLMSISAFYLFFFK